MLIVCQCQMLSTAGIESDTTAAYYEVSTSQQQSPCKGNIIDATLEMRKLRFEEVKYSPKATWPISSKAVI